MRWTRPAAIWAQGVAALAMFCTPSVAKVGGGTLDELVAYSDRIVVARIDAVTPQPDGTVLAVAAVQDTWKGLARASVTFDSSSTWTCDISESHAGETVVLFLERPRWFRTLRIAQSGRGRMPVSEVRGVAMCEMWTGEIALPPGVVTHDGPDARYDFIRWVEVASLKQAVTASQVAARDAIIDFARPFAPVAALVGVLALLQVRAYRRRLTRRCS